MLINKITVGWITQTYDTEQKKFIHQEFFAGDQVDYENTESVVVRSELLLVDDKEVYLPFDMVQPNIGFVRLLDPKGQSLGILKTNADEQILNTLLKEYLELDEDNKGVNEFIIFCKQKYPESIFNLFHINKEMTLKL